MRRYITPYIRLKLEVTGNRIAQIGVNENSFIDWGDGAPAERFSSTIAHTYAKDGSYDVVVIGVGTMFMCGMYGNLNFKASRIDLNNCKQLEILSIVNYAGTSVDLSNLINLKNVTINNSSTINAIHGLEHLSKLTLLDFTNITQLSLINTSAMPLLAGIYADNTAVSAFDFSNNGNLARIRISNCHQLQGLVVIDKPKLLTLHVSSNVMTSFELVNCPKLYDLIITNTKLSSIIISTLPELLTFNANCDATTYLENIKFSNVPKLYQIYLNGNKLSRLDLSGVPALRRLSAENNYAQTPFNLTNLILPSTKKLEYVRLCNNKITTLDLSNNLNLNYLSILGELVSSLTNLNLENCPLKEFYFCKNIGINSLNLNTNTNLEITDLRSNNFTDIILNTSKPLVLNVGTSLNAMTSDLIFDKLTYKALIIRDYHHNIFLPPLNHLINNVQVNDARLLTPITGGRFVLNALNCPHLFFEGVEKTTKEVLQYIAQQVIDNNLYDYPQYFTGTKLSESDTKDLYDNVIKTLLHDSVIKFLHGYAEDSTGIAFNFKESIIKPSAIRTIRLKNDADVLLVPRLHANFKDVGSRIKISNGVAAAKGTATCTSFNNGDGTTTYTFSLKSFSEADVWVFENKYGNDYTTRIIS